MPDKLEEVRKKCLNCKIEGLFMKQEKQLFCDNWKYVLTCPPSQDWINGELDKMRDNDLMLVDESPKLEELKEDEDIADQAEEEKEEINELDEIKNI